MCPRLVHQPDYDHPAWCESGAVPTPATHPDAFYIERVYPAKPETGRTRTQPKLNLSKTAMRKRLSRAGLRGPELARVVAELKAGPGALSADHLCGGSQALGWPVEQLKAHFGKKIARALLRNVRQMFLIMDEIGYYSAPGIAELFKEARKHNVQSELVTQGEVGADIVARCKELLPVFV